MNFENEIWKDIPNYEGTYQVSNLGRVRSLDRMVLRKDGRSERHSGTIIKQHINRGYHYVRLCKNSSYRSLKVHRLVAEAFIPNINNLPQVNHMDENKSNNSVGNLEWCTMEYNIRYGTAFQRTRDSHIKLHGKKVVMYSSDGDIVKTFECTKDLEREGFDRRAVNRCCRNISNTHKGYKFQYAN